MATKKRNSKKSSAKTAKKPAAKKSPAKASAAKLASPAPAPTTLKTGPRWEIWVPLLVVVLPLLFAVVYNVTRPDNTVPARSSQSANGDNELRVVPSNGGGSGSSQASGALQPQATGLQQSQSATQSANGLNLQAQTTPNQAPIR